MNFYTLTFKKKLLIAFLFILVGFIIVNIALYFVINSKSTKTAFISEVDSKIKHFLLNDTINKDIIFLGSSRTFYNISTKIFKDNGLDIYNFGISGFSQFTNHPALIPHIIQSKPKNVVISLNVDRLYNDLPIAQHPTLEELKYYFKIDKKKFLSALKPWVVNSYLFVRYSEKIYYTLKSMYARFDNTPIKKSKTTIDDAKDTNYTKIADCNIFSTNKTGVQVVLKCTNGDGMILKQEKKPEKYIKKEILKKPNKYSIKYLSNIINELHSNDINVIVILQPIIYNPYDYNLTTINHTIKNARVIDLTNYSIPHQYWVDNTHITYEGRAYYSEYLSTILKIFK